FKILLFAVILLTIRQISSSGELIKFFKKPLSHILKYLLNNIIYFLRVRNIYNEWKTLYKTKYITPKTTYYIFFLLNGFICLVVNFLLNFVSHSIGESMIPKKKWSNRIRQMKVERFKLMFFNLIYFTIISIFGFIVLRHETYFPKELGGTGKLDDYFKGYPNQKTLNLIHIYYFLNGGYLLTSIFF
ncbi:longevity-assurance (LAG1) protein, putative, partial [Hepatocystis sp. ex Piliocolobus tephrosceles]